MKNIIIIILIVLGFYWLLAHTMPASFSHEAFGLMEHSIHRIIGIVLLVVAFLIAWMKRG